MRDTIVILICEIIGSILGPGSIASCGIGLIITHPDSGIMNYVTGTFMMILGILLLYPLTLCIKESIKTIKTCKR